MALFMFILDTNLDTVRIDYIVHRDWAIKRNHTRVQGHQVSRDRLKKRITFPARVLRSPPYNEFAIACRLEDFA